MCPNGTSGMQWFSLSRRELLVLAVAAALVLAAVGAAQAARRLWGRCQVQVNEQADVLSLPPRLNVNAARAYELALLPGIGPKTAEAIVAYREEHGPFPSLESLLQVPGIGPATLDKIRPHAMCAPVPRETD